MELCSTRNTRQTTNPLWATVDSMPSGGGLWAMESLPRLKSQDQCECAKGSYAHHAATVLSMLFDCSVEAMQKLTTAAYTRFDTPEITKIAPLGQDRVLELFHGPTLAFKDMALQFLPHVMAQAAQAMARKEKILILTATSGDTGKAALEGFRDVPGTSVLVFYPKDGVAEMQRKQMVTQQGGNVSVCAVEGNFDDAQRGVKEIFADEAFAQELRAQGYCLSSANSINFGRLAPQICYYVNARARLVNDGALRPDQDLDVIVPTGNFGNILAAYYAKQMGAGLGTLICASNANDVLTEFFTTGNYNSRRPFHKTMSPSMDILVSSNLERLLFAESGRNEAEVQRMMDSLAQTGQYALQPDIAQKFKTKYPAYSCNDEETAAAIRATWEQHKYLLDTHTAVAVGALAKHRAAGCANSPVLIASTASPFKFAPDVYRALTGVQVDDAFEACQRLADHTGQSVPQAISELRTLPERHNAVCARSRMRDAVRAFVREMDK